MKPLQLFADVWARADMLSTIQAFIANNTAAALRPDEILRAEWVARVSALDLFVHELVAQRMLSIQIGGLPSTPASRKFRVSTETAHRMAVGPPADAGAAFDLDVREQHSLLTFQMPEKIADAIRLTSAVELWNAVAAHQSAPPAEVKQKVKDLKATLSLIVARRNKIAHEGDLQPGLPRSPWAISQADLQEVRNFLHELVAAIDSVVAAGDPIAVPATPSTPAPSLTPIPEPTPAIAAAVPAVVTPPPPTPMPDS